MRSVSWEAAGVTPRTLDRACLLGAVRTLTRRDRALAGLVARHGPPPLWARCPGFTTLLRIILEQQVSLSSANALYLRLAETVRPFDHLGILDAEVRERLMAVPGIGPWTAGIYLLMALRRPDVWPPGDLALLKALGRLHGSTSVLSPGDVDAITARWRPFRAVAARILWHAYLAERAA